MGCQNSEEELKTPSNDADTCVIHLPRPLNIEEKKYLLAVERGDLANVKRFIQSARKDGVNGKPVDVNCLDSLGRGALSLAIEAENLQMVELLVVMGVETRDALLRAVDQEFVEAVELLLEHEELLTADAIGEENPAKEIAHSWQKIDPASARYPPEITPLILAAQRNNYEILKLLLDRGASLPMPHDIRCGCADCLRSTTGDPLRLSSTRISEYKALASSSLIALSSPDPLLTAFQLSWELRDLTIAEPESRAEYLKLRRQVERFAVDLLQQVRTTAELQTILNYEPIDGGKSAARQLARLELAVRYKQKTFVAHSHVQQLLAAIWYDGLPGFRRMSTWQRCGVLAKIAIMFPFYCTMYFLAPDSKIGQPMRKPFVKFLVHASSYLFFLLMLILVSQRAEVGLVRIFGGEDAKRGLETESAGQRGAAPSRLEGIVVLYVLGFIWQEAREVLVSSRSYSNNRKKAYVDGLKAYLRDTWNFIDFTRNFLYIATIVLRTAAYLRQRAEIREDPTAALVPRETWSDLDPQLIAEGLFAAASVFSALKLIRLFSIHPHLGPLQISLGRMVTDVAKFFFIYTLVLFAFACGLNQLLWYFAELERRKCYVGFGDPSWDAASEACLRWRRFSNLFESCQSLFWASFGGIGVESFELTGIKSYTRFWGLLMFGSYSAINVIVLLNLLIAMMSNSYAMTEERADTEWKFARTKLWMSYFEEGGTLPSPFNILPSPKLPLRLCGLQKRKQVKREAGDRRRTRDSKYGAVMRALVWRYVVNAHSAREMDPVTEDDVHELKSDLSAWRCELLEILRRNGMDIAGADTKDRVIVMRKRRPAVPGRRMKVWERRLMKDFHVGSPVDEQGSLEPPSADEDKVSRWKRVAKLAVLQAADHRWSQVVDSAARSSQIGKSNSQASKQSQLSLRKAMQEAQRLANDCSLTPVAPVELPESTASTILHVLQDIVETGDNSPKMLADPPKLTVSLDPGASIVKPKPLTSMDYVDEKPIKLAPAVPLRTSPRIVRKKSANSATAVYQQPIEASSMPAYDTSTLKVPSGSPRSPRQRQALTDSTLFVPVDSRLNKSRVKPALSPKKNFTVGDKEKLVGMLKSPRFPKSRSPRRGGWL